MQFYIIYLKELSELLFNWSRFIWDYSGIITVL